MSNHNKRQIWPDIYIGCSCGCEAVGDGPGDEANEDSVTYDSFITDPYNSTSYPWNRPEPDYWTEDKDRQAEEQA